jgi:ERF superfamily
MTAETAAPACAQPVFTPMLFAALAAFQAELPRVMKEKTAHVKSERTGNEFSYDYADLADVSAAALPLLGKHGLAFTAWPVTRGTEAWLDYSLIHKSGEERSGTWKLGSATLPPQTMGGLITYARRYMLCAATGIVADVDDDAQKAQRASERAAGDRQLKSKAAKQGQGADSADGGDAVGPEVDKVAQALANLALQIASTKGSTVDELRQKVHAQAQAKNKLAAMVESPFGGQGVCKLSEVLTRAKATIEAPGPATVPAT